MTCNASQRCSIRAVAKLIAVSSLAGLFLQGVFCPIRAQAKYAPFPVIRISSQSIWFQSAESVAARLATQNALFKEQFEDDMRASPESETARGDYRDNAMLDDYSLAASAKQNAVDRVYRAKLAAISTEGFPEQDGISHDLLLWCGRCRNIAIWVGRRRIQ